MPVRIYDISKKLGLDNKAILAKAKSLGIAAAKVPSSSLDKISAEYLEEELCKDHPELAAKLAPPPPPAPKAAPSEPIVVIKPPPEPPKPEVKEEPPKVERGSATGGGSAQTAPAPGRTGRSEGRRKGRVHSIADAPAAAHRRQDRSGQTGTGASGRAAADGFPTAISTFSRPAVNRRPPPANRQSPPPRRSHPSLSRPPPARSSSSNRRLSSANWPPSSSRSPSRSLPI